MTTTSASRVIVLGAGPVGLGAALELARFGVPTVLIEKHDGTSWHPKTRNFNTRTMEIAKGWGAATYKRLRSIDAPDGWKSPIRFLRSATGERVRHDRVEGIRGARSRRQPGVADHVVAGADRGDPARRRARVRPGRRPVRDARRRGWSRAAAPTTTASSSRCSRAPAVPRRPLSGAALVAADGAASLIRDAARAGLGGPARTSRTSSTATSAPTSSATSATRKGVLFFVSNEGAQGVLQPLDGAGRWLCQISVGPDEWSLDVFTKERARRWVRAAVGVEDLEPEILSLGLWKLNATVVDRLVQGRVVICGDAAHQFPPTGGLGVNTGLQGMHNAMWKLAYCVRGMAGWAAARDLPDRATRRVPTDHQPIAPELDQRRPHQRRRRRGRRERPQHRGSGRRRAALRQPPRRRVRRGLRLARPSSPTAPSRRSSRTATPTTSSRRRPAAARRTSGSGAPTPSSRPSTSSDRRSRCSPPPQAARGRRRRPRSPATSASRSMPTRSAAPASTISAASRGPTD